MVRFVKIFVEVQQHCSTSGYIPRWHKLPKQPIQAKCANPSCTTAEHQKLVKPVFVSTNKIKIVFQVEAADKEYPFILCHAYNLFHFKNSGISCGIVPKSGLSFSGYILMQQRL